MFNVGDKVKGVYNKKARYSWASEMNKYVDKVMTIRHISEAGCIRVKENTFSWCDKTLAPIESVDKESTTAKITIELPTGTIKIDATISKEELTKLLMEVL